MCQNIKTRCSKRMSNRLTNLEYLFWAKMVEAIKRTKNRHIEPVKIYNEEKAWDNLPNKNDSVDDNDESYKLGDWGEPWNTILPQAKIGASFQQLPFWSIIVGGGGCFCCLLCVWSYSKCCEQMIIDFHQLSHYYNILRT